MNKKSLFFSLLLTTGLAHAAPTDSPALVLNAEFGIFNISPTSEVTFEQSKVVPYQVGQRYGWVIDVSTKRRRVSVREEYLLPSKAVEDLNTANTPGAKMTIPLPRRSQVSQREMVPVGGKIYGEWAIGENEPGGHRHLQVFVDNELAGDFEYDVQ